MTSDERRREVAARLRDVSARCGDTPWMVEDLFQALGFQSYEEGDVLLFYVLADLIDRQTCHDVGDGYTFRCSACGCELDLDDREGEPTMWLGGGPMTPRHCPNCGAVVSEKEESDGQ